MKQIPLTQGKIALVDDEDFARVSKLKWHYQKSAQTAVRLEYENATDTLILMHRFVLNVVDSRFSVKHKNGNKLDNQKINLIIMKTNTPRKPIKFCSITDCDKPTKGLGFCHKHYKRFKTHGDPLKSLVNHEMKQGQAGLNFLFYSYKRRARNKEIPFTLTLKEFEIFTSSLCHYCGASPSNISMRERKKASYIFNGIDRLNNLLGYTIENCVPCCEICNIMKLTLTVEEFKEHITKIYNHFHE